MRRVEQVLLARRVRRLLADRQVGDPQRLVRRQVELDEAVQERQLQVGDPLAGRDRHRAHGGGVALVAVLGEHLADVEALEHRVALGVDDLEPAIALRGVRDRLVGRRVDEPDAGVEDLRAVGGVVALVRRVARLELPDLGARRGVERVHLARRRIAHQQPRAVRRDRHVVGAVALHREAPDDLARRDLDPHDVGEARPRDVDEAPVVGGEHVVGVLVVALADQRPHGDEVAELARVQRLLLQPLLEVRDDVEAAELGERLRIDDVGGAVPVVGDEQDGLRAGHDGRAGVLRGGARGQREREGGDRGGERRLSSGDHAADRNPVPQRGAPVPSSVTSASMSFAPSALATDTRWWPSRT